jgi:hypothetical protein
MNNYQAMISGIVPNHNPRHVEAFMRCEHSTLDGLSRDMFRQEAVLASACVDEAGADMAELLAQSFGL